MRTTAKMGLTSWDQPQDVYSNAQLAGNWQLVDFHDHSPGRGVPIPAGGLAPGAVLSPSIAAGVIGAQHLSTPLLQNLGINSGTQIGRGVFAKAGADTTTSATFVSLTDRVPGLVLAANGFIAVDYHALWKVSAGTGSADIFIGSTQVVSGQSVNGAPTTAAITTTQTHLSPLWSNGGGLGTANSTTADSSDVTTGETIGGGVVRIFGLAAGTYTVGIRFSVTGGNTLTVQNRHLWVLAYNFL